MIKHSTRLVSNPQALQQHVVAKRRLESSDVRGFVGCCLFHIVAQKAGNHFERIGIGARTLAGSRAGHIQPLDASTPHKHDRQLHSARHWDLAPVDQPVWFAQPDAVIDRLLSTTFQFVEIENERAVRVNNVLNRAKLVVSRL